MLREGVLVRFPPAAANVAFRVNEGLLNASANS
jgi:hypothetical protein